MGACTALMRKPTYLVNYLIQPSFIREKHPVRVVVVVYRKCVLADDSQASLDLRLIIQIVHYQKIREW